MSKEEPKAWTFDSLMGDLFKGVFQESKMEKAYAKHGPSILPTTNESYRGVIDPSGLSLEIDLPGIAITDVSVWALKNQIIVKGQRADKKFTNRYTISAEFDVRSAKASMANGLLIVKLDRAGVEEESLRIPVAQR